MIAGINKVPMWRFGHIEIGSAVLKFAISPTRYQLVSSTVCQNLECAYAGFKHVRASV
jgi:hypothetical protein